MKINLAGKGMFSHIHCPRIDDNNDDDDDDDDGDDEDEDNDFHSVENQHFIKCTCLKSAIVYKLR